MIQSWTGNHYDLIVELIKKEIKVRYKNSYFGYLWSLANPLLMALVFYFIFKIVTKVEMENYALFLISALFVWQWMLNTITTGVVIFIDNASLIKKVNFPRNYLVFALMASEGFNFLASIPVLLGFMFVADVDLNFLSILLFPLLLFVTGIFIYSISLIVATINMFFRDMQRLISILMMLLFYGTPILYPISMVPEQYHILIYSNPFTPFILSWKALFIGGDISFLEIFQVLSYTIISYVFATWLYEKLKYRFAELV